MADCPLVWIVIGVAGSGKTVIGRLLAERLECDFLEGDRRHPLSNLEKMRSQIPLEDADRHQWLVALEADIGRATALKRETVMTCSSLKADYRQRLMAPGRVQLVWLDVPRSELERRLQQRENHYMKPEMLESQLAAFEAVGLEENVMTIDGLLSPAEIVSAVLDRATALFPEMSGDWWQRCV
jgi:gluconokinase